ncbi:MAG: SCO family protein [Planctomycetota bacterium]|jgi:cytochrome oxidase Cu insertion factor (SCO1/SenC/PrrC family)|nr:SCO family protein [Planctomycetota bacterium]
MRQYFLGLVTCLALQAGCSSEQTSSMNVSAESGKTFGTLPELDFTDSADELVSPARLKGSVWALSLVSTSLPGPNRPFLKRLLEVQEILGGSDTRIVSLSVDPLGDTSESLAALGEAHGADPNFWFFWRGSEANTSQLIHRAYRNAILGMSSDRMSEFMVGAFEPRVVAIDREGRIRGAYDLLSADGPELLLGRLRQLAKE